MEAITLDKLNSSSFEKLCRTIALAKFGVAGNVFPAGADAGRDFSYSGPIAGYENLGWDGYLVLQAKFKSSLNSGKPNVEWILNQLIKEFSKFEDGNGYLVPEYYIVATNVSLSGADSYSTSPRQGGLAKVEEKLKALCEAHGVKGFDIWGADKIIDLLGMYPAIRSSYSTWLMPGDVLEAIAKKIFNKDEDFSRALKIALIHSLRRDKNVRLKDAGSVSDDQIRSSQVFVDLPASLSNSRLASSFPFVAQVVELAKTVFKPSLNLGGDRKIDNKVVLLGGPGQGKSTASLYLVQLFRSNLLASDSSQMIDGALQDLIGETLQRSCEENIPACLPSRYPFHISLPAYADLVSESKKVGSRKISLMRYAVDELGSITDTDFDVPMFRRWLEGFPCLFVFDGLDEVPPSGERKEIIAAINDFVGELVALDSDYFVMVTSRPQGYNSDLDGVHWTHWNLDDLSSDKAIAYARLLAKSCYRDDPDRQKKITAHLEVSIENPITRRLMLSPLQVTILHMIVDTGGGVPSSRWNIFNDYFEILKRREKAKSGAAQKILDKNIHLIGPIHQRAGLVLHVESERAGQATSHLDNDKFAELIRGYLKTEEYEFRDSLTRESELSELALNRLVLLSAREEGRISFDVRSLQEYMAASALTAASPEVIEFRLHHLAGRSHWQHVFTIAASRCFSEDNLHYLRSVITNIPRQLDVNEAHKVVGRGARLSFELFCDGIAADQPKHRRQLASHAMELLFYGSYHLRLPLSMLSEEHTENLIMEELKQRYLVASSPEVKAAAWNLLVQLAMCGVRPAVYYLGRHWPSNSQDVFEIIRFGVLPVGLSSGLGSIVEVVCSRPLTELAKSASSLIDLCIRGTGYLSEGDNGLEVSSIRNIFSVFNSKKIKASAFGVGSPISMSINPIDGLGLIRKPSQLHGVHEEWNLIFAASEFSRGPSLDAIMGCIDIFLKIDIVKRDELLSYLPWPLMYVLSDAKESAAELIDALLGGRYGYSGQWLDAEGRALRLGFSDADFLYSDKFEGPNPNIATIGCLPYVEAIFEGRNISNIVPSYISVLMKVFSECQSENLKLTLADWICWLAEYTDKEFWKDYYELGVINEILSRYNDVDMSIAVFNLVDMAGWSEQKSILYSKISENLYFRSPGFRHFYGDLNEIPLLKICAYLEQDSKFMGFANLLCCYALLNPALKIPFPVAAIKALISNEHKLIRFSAHVILLLVEEINAIQFVSILPIVFESGKNLKSILNCLNLMLESSLFSNDQKILICVHAVRALDEAGSNSKQLFQERLSRILDSDLSGLATYEVWDRLGLPADAFIRNG